MAQFSEKTKHLLEQAGWTEGRVIDPIPYVEALKIKGFIVFAPVLEFLRQFGGLKILYSMYVDVGDYRVTSDYILHFDTTDIYATSLRSVEHDASLIKTSLCLIGEADDYFTSLMMDSLGRVYASTEEHIYLIGETGEAAIESFLSDDPSQAIEVWRYSDSPQP